MLVLVLGLKIAGLWRAALRRAPAAAAVLLVAGLSGLPTPAAAQPFPSPELLEALKTRLLEPPDCHPDCADIPHLRLQATGDTLELVMTVDAKAAVALPVPGGTGVWTPTAVTLDGEPYDGLRRGKAGPLAVAVQPGRWSLGLAGPLPPRAQIELPLPQRPRRVEVVADGWRVEGIDDKGRPGPQIRLVRLRREGQANALQPTALPPLLLVRRTLRLGVDWRVQTQVERRSAPDAPVVLEVPLIPGEQVLREEAQVRADRLLVSLAPGQLVLQPGAGGRHPAARLRGPAPQRGMAGGSEPPVAPDGGGHSHGPSSGPPQAVAAHLAALARRDSVARSLPPGGGPRSDPDPGRERLPDPAGATGGRGGAGADPAQQPGRSAPDPAAPRAPSCNG